MRIVIDMQPSQSFYSGSRGVGRYTSNLVKFALAKSRGHEFFLALNGAFPDSIDPIRAEFDGLIEQDHIVVWQNRLKTTFDIHPEVQAPPKSSVKAAEIVRETFLTALQPDIIFATNLQEGFSDPAVTSVKAVPSPVLYASTLHDLIPLHFKSHHLANEQIAEWYYEKIDHVKRSDIILTVSHASKTDLVELLGLPPENVHVVENGHDSDVFNPSPVTEQAGRAVLETYRLPRSFLFYFGGNDLCKNVRRLLAGYARLPQALRRQYPLVLGGKTFVQDKYGGGHMEARGWIKELGLQEDVLTPGFIDDRDLPLLLKLCHSFIFPSTHEGFGLPALEAMACGAPVIASNTSSIAEVVNFEPAFFDPFSEDGIAAKITEVLENPGLRSTLSDNGLKRANCYTWEQAAEKLLDVFERFDGKANSKGFYPGDVLSRAMLDLAPVVDDFKNDELTALARMVDETFLPSGQPTIHLDISTVVFLDDRSGIQRVTRAVASEMLKAQIGGYQVELIYSSPDDLNFYAANRYKRTTLGLDCPAQDTFIAFKPSDILIYLDQAPRMAINHKDHIRYLRSIGVKVYFFIHDLIPIHHPKWFSQGGVEEFIELIDTVCSSDGALCNSRATADDVRAYVAPRLESRRLPFRIAYAHLAADIANSVQTTGLPDDAAGVLEQIEARPSILMVGTIEPRKGHRQTLAAFEQLWQAGLEANLVIIGRWGWKMDGFDLELLNHPLAGKRLFWLKGISDDYLMKVYEASTCLLSASEAEGFGLPLIEAARHGLPVIARDIAVFREVGQDSAFYFPDSKSPAAIADAIRSWFQLYAAGKHPESSKMKIGTWAECVATILAAIIGNQWTYQLQRPQPQN